MTSPEHAVEKDAPRKPTVEEAEAILTLVRGGWLRLELTLNASPKGCPCGHDAGDHSPLGACRMCFGYCVTPPGAGRP